MKPQLHLLSKAALGLQTTPLRPIVRTTIKMAMLLIAVMLLMPQVAMADGSPWKYVENSKRSHKTAWGDGIITYTYKKANGEKWSNKNVSIGDKWTDEDGEGFTIHGGKSDEKSRMGVLAIWSCTKEVPAYTVITLTWNYKMTTHSASHEVHERLYALDNLEDLKNKSLVFNNVHTTMDDNCSYLFGEDHCWQDNTHESVAKTKKFTFDNCSSSKSSTKSWYMISAYAAGNGGDKTKSFDKIWGAFKHVNATWTTDYYKYVVFDSNNGTGNKTEQTIVNSDKLKVNTFSRAGYYFTGWNTKANGKGTAFADGVSISATESSKGYVTLYAQWASAPTNLKGSFDQDKGTVHLTWSINSDQQQTMGKFVVYRNGISVKQIDRTSSKYDYSWDDTEFTYESKPVYTVYYVPNGKEITTQISGLRSNKCEVITNRTLSIKQFDAESKEDRVVITWASDSHKSNWGHYFYVYIDNEKTPIDTIKPADNQTSFRWEHRHTDKHTDRQNFHDSKANIDYVEEKLSGTVPHDYRLVGMIDNLKKCEQSATKRGITTATKIYSLDATKGVYSDKVKLSWHVNQQGTTTNKTYIVSRRVAESDSAQATIIGTFDSNSDYLTFVDDTPSPGVYYFYMVTVQDVSKDGVTFEAQTTDVGFAQNFGTVSGRITYGNGTGVSGAEVVAELSDNNDRYRGLAIRFTGANGNVQWKYPSEDYFQTTFLDNDWSIQMWIRPDSIKNQLILKLGHWFSFRMQENGNSYCWLGSGSSFGPKYSANEYQHLTIAKDNDSIRMWLINSNGDIQYKKKKWPNLKTTSTGYLTIGSGSGFTGYIDEFRLWTRCLTKDEILENYDRQLVGTEQNLETYWTFDEGLSSYCFDYSHTDASYNGHHGTLDVNVQSSENVPDNLKTKVLTDADGNYIIRGIPFSGDGTTYAIRPVLGTHDFTPSGRLCYVSNSSLVHTNVDFVDVSSFTVSGAVYYDGTDYPVEGCALYVDGQPCMREDGNPAVTDNLGYFNINVPIGEHYIQVKKDGHVFADEGRYPRTGTHKFNQDLHDRNFYDSTLVNFTGRVVGGNYEADKPVGFRLSENNIGVATLTLRPVNERYQLNMSAEELPVVSARPDTIRSTSHRGSGNNSRKIIIKTDPVSGEFSAMIPPLNYVLDDIYVESSKLQVINNARTIDMTDPQVAHRDSVRDNAGIMRYYDYHTMLRQAYHPDRAIFTVRQNGHHDGSFGMDICVIDDELGKLVIKDIYDIGDDGKVKYKYRYPLFRTYDPYTFDIEGYEEFVNCDNAIPDTSRVPMSNTIVTILNALSSDQSVYLPDNQYGEEAGSVYDLRSNQLRLDSLGKATYSWYGGLPNVSGDHTRTLNIYYGDDNKPWEGNPMTGILLGNLPTEINFVTRGPDNVDMILRDPPGSQSYSTWETGTVTNVCEFSSFSSSSTYGKTSGFDFMVDVSISLPLGSGDGWFPSIGVGGVHGEAQTKDGKEYTTQVVNSNTMMRSVSVTQAISTSDRPEFDGADGDLFIGTETNLLFGNTLKVGLFRDPSDTTKANIGTRDNMGVSMTFGTDFVYSQYAIEHKMIPELERLRNSLIIPGTDTVNVTNNSKEPIYVSPLLSDNPKFGTSDTYTQILPAGADSKKNFTDTIQYFNMQINRWKTILAANEEEKLSAYQMRSTLADEGKAVNRSLDGGASITMTTTAEIEESLSFTSTADTVKFGGSSGGFNILFGGRWSKSWSEGKETSSTYELGKQANATFSYTLRDEDLDDVISVDIYTDQGLYGSPIFRTIAGQTSNPYEPKVETKYFQPGHTIMEATMQIEKPYIEVVQPVMSNVPAGSEATYELHLANLSPVELDRPFRLFMADNTNPYGAQLLVDGMPLTDGRVVRISAGQTVIKTLQLKQSNMDVLDYRNIGLVLASVGQSDPMSGMPVIADTVYVSASFIPAPSPVTMDLDKTLLNTMSGSDITITMRDFNLNYHNQKAFRLQYKPKGGEWVQFHEYVLDDSALGDNGSELLPADAFSVKYTLPMRDFKDGSYSFRIVSVCNFSDGEIYAYSNDETVIKDTSYPRPLGQAEPADGILDIGDELSITYNMPFLGNELTKNDFIVTGVLNGAPVEHHTALRAYQHDGADAPAAHTEANINLSGKDYSIDAWLNIHSAGTLLRHGSGKQTMEIRIDEAGYLIVAFFGDSVKYESKQAIPYNEWVFFTFSCEALENQKGSISAAVVTDADIIYPFTELDAPIYYGNGPLAVGCGAGADIHELLLWDETRDIATALQQRSVTKTPSTRHLIGYWKMNEGEGKSIRDYARNRHMVMPAETWYLNNVNKAVALDGTQHIAAYTADVAPSADDDYAMELWMQCGTQADTAQLMQLGEVSLWLDIKGRLHLQNNDNDQMVNDQSLNDGKWHHAMLNVRRTGTAAVYIDGQRSLTVSASVIGDFMSDSLVVGARRSVLAPATDIAATKYGYDRYFTGAVDEIRLWKTTIQSDLLVSKRKIRLNGDEPGLSLYYPFEQTVRDDNQQSDAEGTMEEMTGNGTEAIVNSQLSIVNYTNDAPALREKPMQTGVDFDFTASDTKIVIDIKEAPAAIDGCTLNFTVQNVRSVNGNISQPATWSAFIHRNELVWQDDELNIVKEADETFTVSTVLINRSGKPQRWSLSELPTSLTASSISGMLDPLEKVTITFRVNETAPLGKHERTIYAMGNNGVPTPLTLHLSVTGDIPEWTANPQDYKYSMTVISQLDFFGHISDDEDDMIAAFIGDSCRGVAKSEYKQRYDGYYQTITIYGDSTDIGKPVTFYAYRASTGVYYTSVTASKTVKYSLMNIVGRYDEPIMLSVNDQIVQRTKLKKGWNWISFFAEANNMSPTEVFKEIADSVVAIKGHQDKTQGIDVGFMLRTDTGWIGSVGTLLCRRSYMVNVKNDCELQLVGKAVNPATHTVRIHKNWGWPGYYGLHRITLANAFAGADPQNGDIVRTQNSASYFDDFEWVGSLQSLEPGQGYAYYSVSDEEKWFAYPSSSIAAAPRRVQRIGNDGDDGNEDPVYTGRFAPDNEYGYPYNMILIGRVLYNGEPAANAEVGIFDGDECRSVGYTDSQGLLLMLVAGEEEATLGYKLVLNDQIYETEETLHYVTDAIVGTPDAPHLIHFGELTGLEDVNADQHSSGVRKVLRNGVIYILRNGHIYTTTGAEVKWEK